MVALTPMVGLLIKVFLLQTEDGVLSDTDIIVFLLHPLGITALLIVCSVSLGILFAKIDVLNKIAAMRPAWTRGLLNITSIANLTRLDLNFLALNSMAASAAMIHRAHTQVIETPLQIR